MPRQVRAIEEGDWAALPGRPFVRGTLRNYGKLVEVDVAPLLEAISGASQPAELRRSSSLEEPLHASGMFGFGNGGSGHPWIWISLLAVGVVALALYFGRDGDVSKIPSWLGPSSLRPAGDGVAAAGGERSASGRRSEPVAIPWCHRAVRRRPTASRRAVQNRHPVLPVPPAHSRRHLRAPPSPLSRPRPLQPHSLRRGRFGRATRRRGWQRRTGVAGAGRGPGGDRAAAHRIRGRELIEIRSGAGKVLYTGTPKGGQTTIYATKGPISLTVARPEKVRVEYDGKPAQLKVAQGASIGRLRLPAQ